MKPSNRTRALRVTVLLVSMLSIGCELQTPSTFGIPCTSTDQCAIGLSCDEPSGRCLPAKEPAPPDTRGMSCERPMPINFQQRGALAYGELATTIVANSERIDACGSGPTSVVVLDVPTQLGADGAPRLGMVLRVHVAAAFPTSVALADSRCGVADPTHCLEADLLGANELVLPAVPAGEHRLVITATGEGAQGGDVFVVVEQVPCPFGFVPNGDACIGFEEVGQIEPRVDHTVSTLSDGAVAIIGGVSATGQPLDTMEIIDERTLATMPLPRAVGPHTVARLASGATLVVGGQDSEFEDELLVLRSGRERPYVSVLGGIAVDITRGTECRAAALPIIEEALAVCPDGLALLSESIIVGGFSCVSDSDCPVDELCVSLYDDGEDAGGTCVCNRSDCYDALDSLFVRELFDSRLDVPASGHVVLALPELANRIVIAGGLAADRSPAHPYSYVQGSTGLQRGREELAELPALQNPTGVALANQVLLIGGRLDGAASTAVALFDPVGTGPPTRLDLAVAREDAGAVTLSGGRVLVVGGENASGLVGTTEIIDPFLGSIAPGPVLPTAITAAQAVVSEQGTFVVGGRAADGLSGAVWRLSELAPALDAAPPQRLFRPSGDDCETATPATSGTYEGTTFDRFDQLDLRSDVDGCEQSFGTRGSEAVFAVDVPAGSALVAAAMPRHEADIVLYALTECTAAQRTCAGYADESIAETLEPETLCVPAANEDRSIFVVVDGYGLRQFDFVLDVEFTAECPL